MRALLVLLICVTACSEPSCPAWDAQGSGPCNLILGYAWDGHRCVALSGCSCVGADCYRLMGDDDGEYCEATACEPRSDASR